MRCFRNCGLHVDYRGMIVPRSKSQLTNDNFNSRATLKACRLSFSLFDSRVLMLIEIRSREQVDTVIMQSMRGGALAQN